MSKSLEALGRHVAEELDRDVSEEGEALARERFVRAAARGPQKPASRARAIGGAAVGALAMAAAIGFYLGRDKHVAAPTFEAAGATARVGVELAATNSPLRFSDGSRVDMKEDAKVRVAALDARGASLVLEAGRAHFDLAPQKTEAWTVRAGDFEVRGAGAKFELSFLVPTQEIDLSVEQGHVELKGSCVDQRSVSAPAHVHVSCAPAHASAPAETATQATPEPTHAALTPKASAPSRPGWRALAAQSRWNEALAEALAGDFDRECDNDSAADLLALGDVARLAHDAPHARHAYETLRARFPGDPNAAVGAFSLGKLAFDEEHAYGEAGRAFDTYLREQPNGPLARDALARSMEAHLRAGDRDTAKTLAQRYLDRYPGGPQEEVARGIVAK